MEQYELSDDRVVLVDKLEEEYVVTLKQKDADDKCVFFYDEQVTVHNSSLYNHRR